MGYAEISDRLEMHIVRGDSRGKYSFPTYQIFCVSHSTINNICFIIYFHPYSNNFIWIKKKQVFVLFLTRPFEKCKTSIYFYM